MHDCNDTTQKLEAAEAVLLDAYDRSTPKGRLAIMASALDAASAGDGVDFDFAVDEAVRALKAAPDDVQARMVDGLVDVLAIGAEADLLRQTTAGEEVPAERERFAVIFHPKVGPGGRYKIPAAVGDALGECIHAAGLDTELALGVALVSGVDVLRDEGGRDGLFSAYYERFPTDEQAAPGEESPRKQAHRYIDELPDEKLEALLPVLISHQLRECGEMHPQADSETSKT